MNIDFYAVLMAVMAIALQVQITILANGDYLGLRVNIGDLLLPFIGLIIFYLIVIKKYKWPLWSVRGCWFWLAAMLCVMSISLLQGYNTNGFLSLWAFVNKYIGFWILLGYMLVGAWVVTNAPDPRRLIFTFISVYCAYFGLQLCVTVAMLFAQSYFEYQFSLPHNPWAGLMGNRNAYMVVTVFCFIAVILSHARKDMKLSNWICGLFWFLLPMFLVHNASRTGWILIAILYLGFICVAPKIAFKKSALPILGGIGLLLFSIYGAGIYSAQGKDQYTHFMELINTPEDDSMYIGDEKRFIAIEDGLELYKSVGNPIIGAGLGTYKPFQINKRGQYIDVMDFTGLWLLVEMGILGLGVFSVFFAICLYAVFKRWREDLAGGGFYLAVLIFMVCFAFMTILHEMLYTRFLWFIMGLALARESLIVPQRRNCQIA